MDSFHTYFSSMNVEYSDHDCCSTAEPAGLNLSLEHTKELHAELARLHKHIVLILITRARVLTILQKDFPAVQAAEMTVKLQPMWWEGWQTLGRAQLNLGEVELAARSFQVALHLHPIERSLWEEDLRWAQHLRQEKHTVQQKATQDDKSQKRINEPPELQLDYADYECDEVIDACTAIEDREKRYEKSKKNITVDVQDAANEMLVRNSNINASKSSLIKARII